MKIINQLWDIAENNFLGWLNKGKSKEKHEQLEIIQSIFFLFRNKQRDNINTLCNQAFERVKDFDFIKEDKFDVGLIAESSREYHPTVSLLGEPETELYEYSFRKQINGIIAGDKQVFLNVYENDFPIVVKFIMQNSGTIENAKDIFQDAIIIMLEKYYYSKLDLTSSVGAYLFGISRNLWYEHLRRNKKSIDAHIFLDEETKDDFIFTGEENQPDIYEDVCKTIESMGSNCQKLIQYYYYEKMSWDKIAKLLGYASAASARNQKYKCLERIRNNLHTQF